MNQRKPEPMNDQEIKVFLNSASDWERLVTEDVEGQENESLHRQLKFSSFEKAMDYMARASQIISTYDHHPTWQNTYNKLDIWLTTHEADNRITERDVNLAKQLEALWADIH